MKITQIRYYDGAKEKICRLGLAHLFLEIQDIFLSLDVAVKEEKNANGGKELRVMIDEKFKEAEDWEKISNGGIDWKKRFRYNQTFIVRIGVEVQVSARSDLLVRDVDVGVIAVPSDRLSHFLPDRCPSFRDAVRYIEEEFKEAANFPLVVIAVEHDRSADVPFAKQKRRA